MREEERGCGGCVAEGSSEQSTAGDRLVGPANEAMAIVWAAAVDLSRHEVWVLSYALSRKEARTHGEGGSMVGAPLAGRVVIVDDVITAGTAIREVMAIMADSPAEPVAVVVALDREEKGKGERSAIQEVEAEFGIPVLSIINLSELLAFMRHELAQETGTELVSAEHIKAISDYQAEFGVSKA